MAIIDPSGLFGGDRIRRCSNAAQLHWPRLFLASDGFARLEINYARIVGRAYATFNPIPSEIELQSYIQEYAKNYLLFLYEVGGPLWGQWDTRSEFLTRYKTAADRRSPVPPEPAFSDWKRSYKEEYKRLPKCFGNFPETFLHGVGVGVGTNLCASPDGNALVCSPSWEDRPSEAGSSEARASAAERSGQSQELRAAQEGWFDAWWREYWLHKAKKAAREAFRRMVTSEEQFRRVMTATRAQNSEMMLREPKHRPYGATWLNGERWEDEPSSTAVPNQSTGRVYEVPLRRSECP